MCLHTIRDQLVAARRRGARRGRGSDSLDKRQVYVQRSDWKGHVTATKGGRLRYVPLTLRLAAALREHRHLRGARVLSQRDG